MPERKAKENECFGYQYKTPQRVVESVHDLQKV